MIGKVKIKFNSASLKKRIWSRISKEQTERLKTYAKEKLYAMATNHTFNNRTYNLQDSLVWGVFFKGHLKSHGFYESARARERSYLHEWSREPIPVNGRSLARSFIRTYHSQVLGGWEVVWAAVAPYSIYLDPKAGTTKTNRFYVISQEYDAIKEMFGRAKGVVIFKAS